MSSLSPPEIDRPPPSSARTYVMGEDSGRLATSTRAFSLSQHHPFMRPVRDAVEKLFCDSVALRMHSVGTIGGNERVDESGTLHFVTVTRRVKQALYGSLENLFRMGKMAEAESFDEGEEEVIIDTIEGGSLNAAIFGIIKGTVGPAILYIPHGFQNSGYMVAVPAMIFSTFMYLYSARRLLECWKVESDRNHQVAARIEEVRTLLERPTHDQLATNTTPEVFAPTLLTYPELARRALGPYAFFVELGIALMQFGVCLTYLIFVPQNLRQCTLALTGIPVPATFFLAVMVLIEIPLSWIADIRKLTPTNVVATILIAYGLSAVLVLAFILGFSSNDEGLVFKQNLAALPRVTHAWFVFIGTSFFMMEGSITLLVPLQEAVFQNEDKARFPDINQKVTTWIVVFYIFFSMVCVGAFGDGIRTAMTASLKGSLATTVQIAYSVAVILTFPLQAFPAMQVVSRAVLGAEATKQPVGDTNNAKRSILATVLTLSLGVLALYTINYLGNVVSILGSLFGVPLALIFPPVMHNVLVKDLSRRTRWMNYLVVGIGIFATGAASFATIVTWDQGAEQS